MSRSDRRSATDRPTIPRPRPAEQPAEAAHRGTRARYWDVATARWRSLSPLPRPRPGD